jgi:glycolate oxidase iron-sulfur subunit
MKETVREDLEHCVKCGSCKALCPTYSHELSEGMSARGRMILLRELERGELKPSKLMADRIYSCLLCGMCDNSCPVGVKITEAVYEGRSALMRSAPGERLLRSVARFALKHPYLAFRVGKTFRSLLPWLTRNEQVPFHVELPEEPLRKGLKIYKPPRPEGRVAVFVGCGVNFMMPQVGESLIRVLAAMNYEVVLPAGEVCCGSPLRAMGAADDAVRMAEKNLEVFSKLKAEAVLSLCPTCTLSIKVQYPMLVGQGIHGAMDAVEFLAPRLGRIGEGLGKADLPGPVAYHDPCHLKFGLDVADEPRSILRAAGVGELTEPREHGCCGFSVSTTHDMLSRGLLEDRAGAFREARTLVTACPGCLYQLARRHRNVMHVVQVLDEAIPHPEEYADDAGTVANAAPMV